MRSWDIQAAKARFADVIALATSEGPQDLTVDGRSVAVVVGRASFDALSDPGESLLAFMRRSPLYGRDDITFARDRSRPRQTRV